jgi:hypothetical protein
MPLFLFVGLTTLTIFLLLTIAPPAWIGPPTDRSFLRGFLLVLAIAAVVFLSGWAIFSAYYPAYGLNFFVFAVTERFFVSIILGIAFGITCGVFIRSTTAGSPYRTLDLREKALGGMLLALLALGVGGDHFLQDAGRRLSKLSFGGAEIAFTVDKTPRGRESSGPPPNLITSSTVGAPSLPIDILTVLPGFISRDEAYIKAAYRIAKDHQPATEMVADNEIFFRQMREAHALGETIIKPMGKCLSTIFNQTGDKGFVRSTFMYLLEPLMHVDALEGYTINKFASETTVGIYLAFEKLFDYTYHRAYNDRNQAKLSRQTQEDRRILEENCLSATYVKCSNEDWAGVQAGVAKLNESATATREKLDSLKKKRLRDCYHDTTKGFATISRLSRKKRTFARDPTCIFSSRPYLPNPTRTRHPSSISRIGSMRTRNGREAIRDIRLPRVGCRCEPSRSCRRSSTTGLQGRVRMRRWFSGRPTSTG